MSIVYRTVSVSVGMKTFLRGFFLIINWNNTAAVHMCYQGWGVCSAEGGRRIKWNSKFSLICSERLWLNRKKNLFFLCDANDQWKVVIKMQSSEVRGDWSASWSVWYIVIMTERCRVCFLRSFVNRKRSLRISMRLRYTGNVELKMKNENVKKNTENRSNRGVI